MEEGGLGGAGSEEEAGVLLYYKYASVNDVPSLVLFYDSNCRSLGLLGRIRIAPDGVNVTIGGKMSSLENHISAVRSQSLFEGTDFKLASCNHPSDERVAKECGFTSLSIRVVKELVTFRTGPSLKTPAILNAGRHLSASEFHSVLQSSGNAMDSEQQKQIVLLDARNVYETRIGKFQTPNVETLDPEIRQYSDLPAWIDEHSEQLHGRNVLMYCTGGIRCEMASAYLRSKGAGYENVFQLYGGIQRYMEHFPDGGYFKGKNFVFDHRISVGSQDAHIFGACLICNTPFDDYSSRCRCTYCRMLVLVCNSCQGKHISGYVCELCQRHDKGGRPVPLIQDNQLPEEFSPDSQGESENGLASLPIRIIPSPELSKGDGSNNHQKKLKVLCLHGFRQNASGFKGRTSSLAKKLKSMVEFVFIDAPHELPFIYQPCSHKQDHDLPQLPTNSNKKFAWLTSTELNKGSCKPGWQIAEEPFDPLQYHEQTQGFEESYAYLKSVVEKMGPFDGILGFSQGAAMAALFCGEQQRLFDVVSCRFAVFCSGFIAGSRKFGDGSVRCPSLHIFGDGLGRDRQIESQASMQLADVFDEGCRVVIKHDMGHIIPTRPPHIDQMKAFLLQFI